MLSSAIDLGDIAGRVLFPSPLQGPWLPFLRFAETVTTGREDDPEGHSHRNEEVLNYVIAGRVDYEDADGHRWILEPGNLELLAAQDETRHKLMAHDPSSPSRWVSVVTRFPRVGGGPSHDFQVKTETLPFHSVAGIRERRLVGQGAAAVSRTGLESTDLEFVEEGKCVCPVGGDRRAVVYVFEGSGSVDGHPVERGTGALIEGVAHSTFEAVKGTRILLASAPRILS